MVWISLCSSWSLSIAVTNSFDPKWNLSLNHTWQDKPGENWSDEGLVLWCQYTNGHLFHRRLLQFWSNFLLMAKECSERWAKCLGLSTHSRTKRKFWLLALDQTSSGPCNHLGIWGIRSRSLSLFLSPTFPFHTLTFKQINK